MQTRSVQMSQDTLHTVLHAAVKKKQHKTAEIYLKEINARKLAMPTSLFGMAIKNKDTAMVRLLVKQKVAAPNNIYHTAVTWKDTALLDFLFVNGVPGAEYKNKEGETALGMAANNQYWGAVSVYLKHVKEPKGQDKHQFGCALLHAVRYSKPYSFIRDILKAKPSLTWYSLNAHNNSLHLAADRGDVTLVSMLLQAGADPNAKNEKGQTAVDLAVANEHWPCVEVFSNPRVSEEEKKHAQQAQNMMVLYLCQGISDPENNLHRLLTENRNILRLIFDYAFSEEDKSFDFDRVNSRLIGDPANRRLMAKVPAYVVEYNRGFFHDRSAESKAFVGRLKLIDETETDTLDGRADKTKREIEGFENSGPTYNGLSRARNLLRTHGLWPLPQAKTSAGGASATVENPPKVPAVSKSLYPKF